jgi:hypothetical protein
MEEEKDSNRVMTGVSIIVSEERLRRMAAAAIWSIIPLFGAPV